MQISSAVVAPGRQPACLHEECPHRRIEPRAGEETVRFFSRSERRSGWTWPGGDRAYSVRDSEIHDIKLRCYHHEYICYGAWVSGNQRHYWGVGANGRQGCQNCCWNCDNDYTQIINLRAD